MFSQFAADFLCATRRRVHAGKKRQHDSVTSRQPNKFTCDVGRTKLRGTPDELVQQLEKLTLLIA